MKTILHLGNHPGAKFPLGTLVITANAQNDLHPEDVQAAITRHHSGDWGNMPEADCAENSHALLNSGRLMSSYTDRNGTKFWILTEWDRSVTTVLLPEDY